MSNHTDKPSDEGLQPIEAALAKLERAVETPVVPGELERWLTNTASAFSALRAMFREQVATVHKEYFESIMAEDSGLLTRVDSMQQEDKAICDELDRLSGQAQKLAEVSESERKDEAAMSNPVETFADTVLDLVIRIRKQEASVETWYAESLQRDRGVVD